MRSLEEIKLIFEKHFGFLRTKELYAEQIFYNEIQNLIQDGLIEKIRYGYYQWVDSDNSSDIVIIKRLFPDGILCIDTALFFHGYSDRIPQAWHIAVSKDSGKSRFKLDYPFVKPYYIEPDLLNVGLSNGDIDGNQIRIYDKERTICDCLRYEKKMDKEIFNKAIRYYISDSSKNIPVLMNYARSFRISQKVKNIIGVWL
jgi:predicted transcriptional regulator of viral defense system